MDDLTIRDAVLNDAPGIATIQVVASRTAYASIFPPGSLTITVENRIPVWKSFIDTGRERILVAEVRGEVLAVRFFRALPR